MGYPGISKLINSIHAVEEIPAAGKTKLGFQRLENPGEFCVVVQGIIQCAAEQTEWRESVLVDESLAEVAGHFLVVADHAAVHACEVGFEPRFLLGRAGGKVRRQSED